jgi:hypothetical protein
VPSADGNEQMADVSMEERETVAQLPHTPPIPLKDADHTVAIHTSLPSPSLKATSAPKAATGSSAAPAAPRVLTGKAKEDADFDVRLGCPLG